MKVGILTLFYRTYNFGAQLQAYALQKTIQNLGYECEQIRFAWSQEQTRFSYSNASVNQTAFGAFAQQIPHSKRIYTSMDLDDANQEYDIFVCGSDQIWGVQGSMPIHVLPQMLLSFAQSNKKKIAYAASFGSVDIVENRKEVLRLFLNNLDFISMREQSAIPAVKRMTNNSVAAVLDPTMLLSGSDWRTLAAQGNGAFPKKPYALLYNVSSSENLRQTAKTFAEQKGLSLVNLAYFEGMAVGPYDFISLIEHADYVITDSFHGSALSVMLHKPFVAFGVDSIPTVFSTNTRVQDMLEICGLHDRFFLKPEGEEWAAILDRPIDYNTVDAHICDAAEHSVDFLKNALCSNQNQVDHAPRNSAKASMRLYDIIVNQGKCTGCGACMQCASAGVRMGQDILGFYKPIFSYDKCVDCGKCLNRCPVYRLQEHSKSHPFTLSALALRAKDEQLLAKNSSGGAFSIIAENIISDGGVVFGAVYDAKNNFRIKHDCASTIEQLGALRKSKYVQSDLNDCFSQAESHLKCGQKVLFTGTPCQIAGLKEYLQKDYEDLYTMDVICGGVTAPVLWEKYVDFYQMECSIDAFDMRSKAQGFFRNDGKLAFAMLHVRGQDACYYEKEMDLFLGSRMAFYGMSCYQCVFKGNYHASDFTIGDFVGFPFISPEKNGNQGMSLVFVRNEKAQSLLERCQRNFISYECSYDEGAAQNKMVDKSPPKPLGIDYLRGIAPTATIEKIFYETDRIRLFQEKENIFRDFSLEQKRRELLLKVRWYAKLQCKLEHDPCITGKIVIYGAGKLGRSLLDCMETEPLCFLDRADQLHNVAGHPVYHPKSKAFEKIYQNDVVTVIVTPVWDYWEIQEALMETYPSLSVVSLEKVVETI